MSSLLLKWLANGVIVAVLLSTLWLAQVVEPRANGAELMIAHALPAAQAASAPATVSR